MIQMASGILFSFVKLAIVLSVATEKTVKIVLRSQFSVLGNTEVIARAAKARGPPSSFSKT